MRRAILFILLTGVVLVPPAASDDAIQTESKPITRADLGVAYMRLDHAYAAHTPSKPADIARINQAFDKATLAFFSGQFANTLRTIDQLSGELLFGKTAPQALAAMSLKAEFDPPVFISQGAGTATVRLRSLYDPKLETSTTFQLALTKSSSPDPQPLKNTEIRVAAEGTTEEPAVINLGLLTPGEYQLAALTEPHPVSLGTYYVVPKSLDEIRAQNSATLDAVAVSTPQLVAAVAACRDRNALLTDHPSTEQSSQFLNDPLRLTTEIEEEIAQLQQGRDPYAQKTGDYWRTIKAGDKSIPLRVYAPESIAREKAPLLVALHGAGGDENMFFEGYGAGVIKRLAEQHKLLVVAPSTYVLSGKPENFDSLVEQLGFDYAIDPQRIYILGHSMGGGATSSLAGKRADKIAAACCLAGGGRTRAETMAPTLVIAAKLDMVVPAAGLEAGAKKGIEAGLPIEFRMLENYGHTLMVGQALPEAVAWLVSHKLGD